MSESDFWGEFEDGKLALFRDRLEALSRKLEEVTDLVKDSDRKIEVAKTHGDQASDNFEKAREVIDNARNSLKVKIRLAKKTASFENHDLVSGGAKVAQQPGQGSSEEGAGSGQEIWQGE